MTQPRFPGVTIDGATARDLDDAIWVERAGSVWRVTVAIANVAAAIPAGSPEDMAARAIGFSRYSAATTIRPMLPRHLSEVALSLLPGEPRPVVVFSADLTDTLDVLDFRIATGLLDHAGRLSHAEAGNLIDRGDPRLHGMMADAWRLAATLLEDRRRSGAIAFFSPDAGLATDEDGHPVRLDASGPVSRAYIVVQELMVLVNLLVAQRFAAAGAPLLFRNHRGNPVADRDALRQDLDVVAGGGAHAEAAGRRLEMMLGRASLGAKALGHWGLNLPIYAWVTSPIRRYADFVNQHQILAALTGEPFPFGFDDINAVAAGINDLATREAEERSASFKMASTRRAVRHLDRARFASLDANDMEAVIKAASAEGAFPDELVAEIEQRLGARSLTAKAMSRLVFGAGPPHAAARTALLRHLESNTADAVAILNHLEQTGRLSRPDGQASEAVDGAAGFTVAICASLDGTAAASGRLAGATRKEARQRAVVALLARFAGAEWAPPQHWQPSALPEKTTGVAAPIDDPKGAVIAACQRMGLPLPAFAVVQKGPPHAPVFSAVASVILAEGRAATEPREAKTRKEAERLAAAALLARLGDGKPMTAEREDGAATATSNPKGLLQERCVALGWPLPFYEVVQSGPAHAPEFRAVVRITTPSGDLASDPATAGVRKEAEKLAAANMLRLSVPASPLFHE